MKKMLTLALVALSALSLQAVTVDTTTFDFDSLNWDAIQEQTGISKPTYLSASEGTVLNVGSLSTTQSWIATTTINLASTFSQTNTSSFVLGLDSSNNSSTGAVALFKSGDSYYIRVNTTNDTHATNVGESVTITMGYDVDSPNQVDFYVNGEYLTTQYFSDISVLDSLAVGGLLSTTGAYGNLYNTWSLANTATGYTITDSAVVVGLSVAEATTITFVPEPTVLALLALGVAGIALKRKVA